LKIIRRAQILRADKGNQEECQTSTQFAELKSFGNVLHRYSTWHIKATMSNGQNSVPILTATLTFKVGAAVKVTPFYWKAWKLIRIAGICCGVFFLSVF